MLFDSLFVVVVVFVLGWFICFFIFFHFVLNIIKTIVALKTATMPWQSMILVTFLKLENMNDYTLQQNTLLLISVINSQQKASYKHRLNWMMLPKNKNKKTQYMLASSFCNGKLRRKMKR